MFCTKMPVCTTWEASKRARDASTMDDWSIDVDEVKTSVVKSGALAVWGGDFWELSFLVVASRLSCCMSSVIGTVQSL